MPFRTGHIADHPAVVDARIDIRHAAFHRAVVQAATGGLPFRTTNRAKLLSKNGGPGVLNQHDVGACEGFAHVSAGTLFFANLGIPKGLISPAMLYLGALLQDQSLQPDGTLSPVTDTGTMPSSILAAWQSFGAVLAQNDPQFPVSSASLYQNPTDPNSVLKLPPIEEFYQASPYRYRGAYFITALGPARLLSAMTVWAAGRTITDAIPASGQDFQGYTGGVLGSLSGPVDHANHLVDYEWTGSTTDWMTFQSAMRNGDQTTFNLLSQYVTLHGVNSWGGDSDDPTGWGESDSVSGATGGCYRANTNHFFQAEDLCVIDLQAA